MLIFFLIAALGFIVFVLLDFGSRKASAPTLTTKEVFTQYICSDVYYLVAGFILSEILIFALIRGETSIIQKLSNVEIPELGVIVSFGIGFMSQSIVTFVRKYKVPFKFDTKGDKIEKAKE